VREADYITGQIIAVDGGRTLQQWGHRWRSRFRQGPEKIELRGPRQGNHGHSSLFSVRI